MNGMLGVGVVWMCLQQLASSQPTVSAFNVTVLVSFCSAQCILSGDFPPGSLISCSQGCGSKGDMVYVSFPYICPTNMVNQTECCTLFLHDVRFGTFGWTPIPSSASVSECGNATLVPDSFPLLPPSTAPTPSQGSNKGLIGLLGLFGVIPIGGSVMVLVLFFRWQSKRPKRGQRIPFVVADSHTGTSIELPVIEPLGVAPQMPPRVT